MTTPSDAELRKELVKLAEEWMESHEQAQFEAWADEALALFQASGQQLLTELLDSKQECTIRNTNPKTRIMRWHSQEGEAVPVSVIERLQNKTNDGGSNGGL